MKISAKQYAQALYDLTGGKSEADVGGVIIKFAEELKRGGQLKLTNKIIEKFNEIWNEQNGIIEAEVVSARGLESYQVCKAENYIKEKYKAKKVVLKNRVDGNIKGGIIIKVGDEIMDGSVAGKLRKLKENLRK
ncbi:ATP synthase F1 subunit delta [bacterium]|nr:ATP synthase F1 subunit delta [bacterium]